MIYSAVMFAMLPLVALAIDATPSALGPYKVSDVTVVSTNFISTLINSF